MTSSKRVSDTKLSTWVRGVSRFGTLCGVAVIIVLTSGCPGLFNNPCSDAATRCNDNNACTTDTCNSSDGTCVNTAVDCGTQVCNPADGACVACVANSDCADDGDVCTAEACGADNTCSSSAIAGCCETNAECDDGDACTADACTDNNCTNVATNCDDGDACTDDSCDSATGCVHTDVACGAGEVCLNGACVTSCTTDGDCADDGDLCTTEACVDGACTSTAVDCSDGAACTDDACDSATGTCTNTDNCTAGTTCNTTTGLCESCTGCTTDAECADDGLFCTGTESCDTAAGCCVSSGDPCDTAGGETCNEALNQCDAPPGTTIDFTLGTDNLSGTAGDDTFDGSLDFNAPTGTNVPTVQTGDVANGGDGTDTLNAQFNFAAGTTVAPTLTAIETLNLTDFGTAATTLSGTAVTGATTVNLSNSTNTNVFTVTNLPNIVNLSMKNQAIGATLSFATAATSGGTDSATVTVNGLTGAGTTLTLTTGNTNGLETLNLVSSTTASSFSDIAMNGTTLTTVNVSGDANLTITTSLDANVTTVNASAATGAVNLTQTNAGAFTFTGGSGNDTIILGASYGTTDTLDGGAGTDDALGVDSAAAVAAGSTQSNVTNFEALEITDALAGAITPARFGSGIVAVDLDAGFGGGSMTVASGTEVTLGARATDPAGTGTGGITVSGSGVSDVVTMTINDCDMGANAITTTGVETLNIVSNGDLDGSAASGGANVFGAALTMTATAATEKVVITGATQLTITGAVTADNIDASAFTGALIMSATSTGATAVTGGSGNDTLYGTTGADVLNGGSGNDTFLGQAGADIITTGTGNDHVSMVVADVGDIITDFTVGTDKFDWNTALSSTDTTVTLPTGTGAFQSAAAGTAIAVTTTVFELTGTTVSTQTAANVVTALGASATNADTNANILFIIYTTGGGGAIWNWINTDADVEAAELTLVATFSTLTADSMTSSDFE